MLPIRIPLDCDCRFPSGGTLTTRHLVLLSILWVATASVVSSDAMAQSVPAPQIPVQQIPATAETLALNVPNAAVSREGNRLFVRMQAEPAERSITIPRCFASLVQVHFLGQSSHPDLTVHPEPTQWQIRWKPSVTYQPVLVLQFDHSPKFAEEVQPVRQAGDGTMILHASQVFTRGEKLRYEPQPHKNTVGYWTVPTDEATWKLSVDRPGPFNVGILQGCGKGQGGSVAKLEVHSDDGVVGQLEFETVETGHFQNFIWRNLGSITIESPGEYELIVKPKAIAKAALMDIRMLHLSPAK